MDQAAKNSNLFSVNTFGSLGQARAYMDDVLRGVIAVDGRDLIDSLERLDCAYDEFPELELDRPRREVLAGLQSTAESLPDRTGIPLLMYCAAAGPPESPALASLVEKLLNSDFHSLLSVVLHSVCYRREFSWSAIEPLENALRQRGQTAIVLQLISELLSCLKFTDEESADFGNVLRGFLSDQHALGIDGELLADAARSARRRLKRPPRGHSASTSRDALLATAERLKRRLRAARLGPHPELGWASGRISFREFLLQWPCEIELSLDLDDTAFIEEAYRAILLREPEITETNQYFALLRDGAASKVWIIEDLLASEELRSLERRVRVICGDQVITDPDNSGGRETPAVSWTWDRPG
jgi:hypothetical protein